ncbi:hypothetical protein OROHE_000867 [Orobanche hederae]
MIWLSISKISLKPSLKEASWRNPCEDVMQKDSDKPFEIVVWPPTKKLFWVPIARSLPDDTLRLCNFGFMTAGLTRWRLDCHTINKSICTIQMTYSGLMNVTSECLHHKSFISQLKVMKEATRNTPPWSEGSSTAVYGPAYVKVQMFTYFQICLLLRNPMSLVKIDVASSFVQFVSSL